MNINQGQQAQLDLQRVLILFKQAGFTFVGIVISAIVIVYTIYPHLPWAITLAWLILALSAMPVRMILMSRFNRELEAGNMSTDRALIWEKRWALATIIPSLSFASSVYLPYSGEQLIIFMFIALVLISMIAGSIVSSITSIKTVMAFMNLAIIPFIARCFMETGTHYLALGSFFIAFYMVFFALAFRMNDTVLSAIKQKIERQEMSYKDSLTGLWNRRKLFSVVEGMVGKPYSLLLIDVDHFKQFNDREGHAKGDEILSDISLSIIRCARQRDLVVRYGGEEFLVLLPQTPLEKAEKLAHKIRERIIFDCDTTVSIGVAHTQMEEDFDSLVELADKAMYQAKKDGRNCVRLAVAKLA